MKTNKLIKEMKKFNRQVPSEELENKVRHNIKTNFVFDEKPAYKFKRSIMKKIILLTSGSLAAAVITLFIFISLHPVGMDSFKTGYDTSYIDKDASLAVITTHKKLEKRTGLKRAAKASSTKYDSLGRISDKKDAVILSECKTVGGSLSQSSDEYKPVLLCENIASESKEWKLNRKRSLAKSKGRRRISGDDYAYNCLVDLPSIHAPMPKSKPREKFNTEDYDRIYDNEFKVAQNTPLSTFSIDVDSASYANLRRFLNSNTMPPKDAARIEEMINYFTYDYPQPKNDLPFTITTEVAKCPWKPENNLVMIGLQGKEIKIDKLPPNNLVFLLDVSGSMNSRNKLPLLKSAFKLLVKQLRPIDRVSIVVYAGAAGLVLDSTSGNQKDKILKAIDNLNAGGSTAGGAGIKLAYKIAKENLISKGNNRIIIATDGDFNIGASSDSELVRLIEEKRDDGIFLTVLGFGMGNYKDNKMEKLADKGNGNYAYIDDIMEAKKVLVNELGATLFTIAKDVKLQIEFNPSEVKAYRLIGYENRILAKEDFNDDKKDAGELGAGHSVTAFYEIVPADSTQTFAKVDDLKYQKTKINKSKELLTVKLRYKKPDENKSKLISRIVKSDDIKNEMSENCAFASAVAEFGMLLRDSEYKGNASYKSILDRARNSKGKDFNGYRAEFVRLVERAELVAPDLGASSKIIINEKITGPVLRGIVSLAGQTSGISARVWVEDTNKKSQKPISGTTTETKSDGSFYIAMNSLPESFIVKAEEPGFFPAVSLVIDKTNLPKDKLIIDIPTGGGFIMGKLITDTGLIITNATAYYIAYGKVNILNPENKLPLNIEKDGTYTTPNLPIGKCDIRFSTPGFLEAGVKTYLKDGETIIKNAIFNSYVEKTCVIKDAVTKKNVSNVEIICISPTNKVLGTSLDYFTDADGKFRVVLGNDELYLEFRHPDYAIIRKYLHSSEKPFNETIEISKGGNVLIKAVNKNNDPIENCKVKLVANHKWFWPYRTEFNDLFTGQSDNSGEILFKNVPTHLPPIFADLIDSTGNISMRSGRFKVKPGITTTVTVCQASAKFIVRFSEPVLGKSIRVELAAPNGWFQYNDFLTTSNEWILPGVVKGKHRVFIRGGDIQNIETNIFVDGKVDTILEINNQNTNSMGFIKGIVHDPSGEKLSAWVHAWKHGALPKNKRELRSGRKCTSFAYPKCGNFVINNLNPNEAYDVSIVIAGLTNIIYHSVIPNGKPLDIITPPAYRITGTLVNNSGEPIIGRIWISSWLFGQNDTSDFELFPVFPGNYTVIIRIAKYPLVKRNVIVTSSDVDLGEIVIDDEGINISGRLLDSKGQPIIDKRIRMYGPPIKTFFGSMGEDMHSAKSNDDGTFEVENLPSDEIITFSIRKFKRKIGPFLIDTNIGDLVIKPPPFSIITVLKADGTPASGLYVSGKKLDENGSYKGLLIENSDTLMIYKTKEDHDDCYEAKISVTDALTNRVTITLPENF